MSDNQLTENQERIYKIIEEKINENGFPPTVREILKELGENSLAYVYNELKVLENLGYIKNDPTKPRTRTVKKEENDVIFIPMISKLNPQKNYLDSVGMLPYPNQVGNPPKFAYKMEGYSLIEKGIYDQDVLIFSNNGASDGDIVIAYADKSTVVGEMAHEENGKLYLKIHNSALNDIHPDSCIVCGTLSAVIRVCEPLDN